MSMSCSRILFAIPDLKQSAGGSRNSFYYLATGVNDRRGNIDVITQDRATPDDPCFVFDPKVIHTHLVRGVFTSKLWAFVTHRLCSHKSLTNLFTTKIDIVFNHGLWDPFNHTIAQIAESCGIPIVVFPHGMLQPHALAIKAWKKRPAWFFYQRRDLQHAAAIVASSMLEAEAIRKAGINRPILLTHWGVHLPILALRRPREKEKRCALFLSRIHPIKGLLNLVAAWANVRPKEWRMIIAGGDENHHQAAVESAVHDARLTDDFEFVGPVYGDIKEKLYREADLFILPSFSENFGVVVGEALSYGVPVITTKGTPWQSLVTNRCGWWVEIGKEPLAVALKEATSLSDTARHRMGKLGRMLVENEFSWAKSVAEIISLGEWIVGKGPMPDCIID